MQILVERKCGMQRKLVTLPNCVMCFYVRDDLTLDALSPVSAMGLSLQLCLFVMATAAPSDRLKELLTQHTKYNVVS